MFILVQLHKVKAEIGEASNNPDALVLEAIHSAGYSGALANPLLAPESAINRLNSTILEEFVAVSLITIYHAHNITLHYLPLNFINKKILDAFVNGLLFGSLGLNSVFVVFSGKLYCSKDGTCSLWC